MKRLLPLLLLAIAASGEEVRLRWALSEGDHRLRSSVTQKLSVTPPGQGPLEIDVETEETWKATVRAAGESWRLSLAWERLRVKEAGGEWTEIDPGMAEGGWAVERLRALRALTFDMVLAPDGRVRSCTATRLDVAAPPGLPEDVHDAMWDPTGLAKTLRALWVRLPPAAPAAEEKIQVEDAEAGVRRLRTWQRKPEDERELPDDGMRALGLAGRTWGRRPDEVMFTGVFPDGAPQPARDTAAAISPDVVSVIWDEAGEYGVVDADLATGVVKGVGIRFRATLRIQVRDGEVIEVWPGETTVEQVLRIDPPQ